jgi:hypothetical protein
MPQIGDVGLAPVRSRRTAGIEYCWAEQIIIPLGFRPPLMTIAEEADESVRFAGYIAEGD